MIDTEHAHICAPARTALLHYLCACVIDLQERTGTACYALCCAYRVTCRTEPVKAEACAAAHLVHKGRVLGSIEYVRHGILYGKHETGRHGEGFSPGIGERRRIRGEKDNRDMTSKNSFSWISLNARAFATLPHSPDQSSRGLPSLSFQ